MSTAEKRSAEEIPEAVKKAKTAEDEEENIEEEEDDLDEEGEEGEEGEDEEGGEDDGVLFQCGSSGLTGYLQEEGEGEGEEGEDDDDEEGEEEEAAEEEDTPAADMSAALSVAMLKAYKEGLGVDFTLVCQGVVKNVHSQVIMARSPYLEARVNRWSEEEKKELIIKDCDPITFEIIVDYMYGVAIPDSVLINKAADEDSPPPPAKKLKVDLRQKIKKLVKLLKISDRLLMVDLKDEVEGILIKAMQSPSYLFESPVCQYLVIMQAEKLSCDKLLAASAKLMGACVRKSVDLGADDQGMLTRICTRVVKRFPKFAAKLLVLALIHPDQIA